MFLRFRSEKRTWAASSTPKARHNDCSAPYRYEQLADQVRGTPLRDVLTHYGFDVKREGTTLRAKTKRHNIVVTGGRWLDNKANVGGGGAIDLVMHIAGVDFSVACRSLADEFRPLSAGQASLSFPSSSGCQTAPEKKSFEELIARYAVRDDSNWPVARACLSETRKIDPAIVDEMHAVGSIYARHHGCVPGRKGTQTTETKRGASTNRRANRASVSGCRLSMEYQHNDTLLYVGLDVHKDSISVAIAESGGSREVRNYGTISNDLRAIVKLFGAIRKAHGIKSSQLRVVYEAGPCGFVIARRLEQLRIDCAVIAPSLTPKKAGDRIKTDRRDAEKLARLHRAGELTAIQVPDPEDEAIRNLCRARTDAVNDLRRVRQQLKAFLLRLGYKYTDKSSWTVAHMCYLRETVFPHAAHKSLLEESVLAITQGVERVERLNAQIEAHAQNWKQKAACEALMAMKGVESLSATILLSELGDVRRFDHPCKLMGFLGLVPSEYSSSDTVRKAQSPNAAIVTPGG
jgi:transposase